MADNNNMKDEYDSSSGGFPKEESPIPHVYIDDARKLRDLYKAMVIRNVRGEEVELELNSKFHPHAGARSDILQENHLLSTVVLSLLKKYVMPGDLEMLQEEDGAIAHIDPVEAYMRGASAGTAETYRIIRRLLEDEQHGREQKAQTELKRASESSPLEILAALKLLLPQGSAHLAKPYLQELSAFLRYVPLEMEAALRTADEERETAREISNKFNLSQALLHYRDNDNYSTVEDSKDQTRAEMAAEAKLRADLEAYEVMAHTGMDIPQPIESEDKSNP